MAGPDFEGVVVPHAPVVGPGGVGGYFEGDVADVGAGAGVGLCWGFRLRDKSGEEDDFRSWCQRVEGVCSFQDVLLSPEKKMRVADSGCK